MPSPLLAPFRLALVVVALPVCLVLVPLVETLRGIAEEWALAFRQARRFVRRSVTA
jgi:hypothetical protein